jgi:hypothetical protein
MKRSNSSRGTTPPVGLAGLLTMISRVERKSSVLVGLDRHRLSAGETDHRFVDRKARIGIHDLGAGFAKYGDGKEHRHLAARHDQDLVRIDGDAPMLENILRHRFAQRQNTVRGGVAVVAVA